jgi:hypothetical protein
MLSQPAMVGKIKAQAIASHVSELLVLLSKVNGFKGHNIYDHSTRVHMLHITVTLTNYLPLSSNITVQSKSLS